MPRSQHAFVLVVALLGFAAAHAATPDDLQRAYEAEMRRAIPAAAASAQRGAAFFRATHGRDWSCATCHGESPVRAGQHARTHKAIAPLAPAANEERFTDAAKVEKWFGRNCGDVLGRACTPQEKADVIAYLRSVR